MTLSTQKSVAAVLNALARQPLAPKADIKLSTVGKMSVRIVAALHESLSNNR